MSEYLTQYPRVPLQLLVRRKLAPPDLVERCLDIRDRLRAQGLGILTPVKQPAYYGSIRFPRIATQIMIPLQMVGKGYFVHLRRKICLNRIGTGVVSPLRAHCEPIDPIAICLSTTPSLLGGVCNGKEVKCP